MSYINKITTAAVLTLSAFAFSSCIGEQMQQEGEVGYLSAPMLDVDVTVDDLTPTKSLDIDIAEPAVTDITFVVKDKNGKEIYNRKGLWSEPLVLPVGNYTVEASAGTNTFGVPYFTGSASGSISPLDQEVPALTLALANALVKVNVEESFTTHFTPGETVSFNQGAYTAGYGEWVFVPSGADLTLSMSGKNSADKNVELTHKLAAPSAKVAYNVTCGQTDNDWPSISLTLKKEDAWASRIFVTTPASFSGNISAENQAAVVYEAIPSASSDWTNAATAVTENNVLVFKGLSEGAEYQVRARVGALVSNLVKITPEVDGLSASANHTTTSGELDGTDVTSSFSKSAAVRNAIESWNINVCKADGTPLREGLSLGNSDGSAITDTKGWPYLPVGNDEEYIVKASATIDGMTHTFEDIALDVPATPSFDLILSSYTSYDKYAGTNNITKDINGDAGANKCDPETIYNAGGRWTLSQNIMANENYSKELVIDYDGDKSRTYSVNSFAANEFYENITECSWKSHQLSVSLTFDNKTVEKSQTHHITGLPYTAAPPTNTGDHSWSIKSGSGISWESSYVLLTSSSGSPRIASPVFNIPASIGVQVLSQVYRNDFYTVASNRFKIYVGNTDHCVVDENLSRKTTTDINKTSTMNSSLNQWFISYSYSVAGPKHEIYYFNLRYQ